MRKKHHEPTSPRSSYSAFDACRAPAALLAFVLVGVAASTARADSPAIAPAVASETRLRIHSTPPDAAVIVDGTHVGLTPYEGTVAPGAHRVTLAHDGYELWSKEVFADGKPIHVGAMLVAAVAAVPSPSPAAAAGASVSFDARMSDTGAVAARVGSWPNPGVALALSIAVPLAGAGLGFGLLIADGRHTGGPALGLAGGIVLATAVAIGPSAGHLYSGVWRAPVVHFFIRASSGAVGAVGTLVGFAGLFGGDLPLAFGGAVLIGTAGLAAVGDILFELVTTYTDAKDLRDERLRTGGVRVGIAPVVSSPWRIAPGVSLSLAY